MTVITEMQVEAALKETLSPNDDVLVHASLGALGQFKAGPDHLIQAMRNVITPGGTLVMMADTRSFAKTGRFWMDKPSETGLLTERFRLTLGVRRSCVPMVSFCALGPRAEEYTRSYHSHLDDDATITRLLANDGKILLFGVGYSKCTLYHLAEERHCTPYNFYKNFKGVLVAEGREVEPISQKYFVRKDMTVRKDPAIAGRMLEDEGGATITPLGMGTLRAFRARAFDDCCTRALNMDPNAFLD